MVAPSGVVLPPGAVYVGVAPTGVRAPLIVPKRCLGGGRGPKCLARWESRQAERQRPAEWRVSSGHAERTNATQSPSEGHAARGARRGQGLSDQLAGGPPGPPNNHNGGSPADPSVLRPGGMLGPRNVRGQSPLGLVVQPDGPRPPLFSGGVGEPLFLLLLRELSSKLAWLSVDEPPARARAQITSGREGYHLGLAMLCLAQWIQRRWPSTGTVPWIWAIPTANTQIEAGPDTRKSPSKSASAS